MPKAKDLTGQRFGRLVVQYKNGHIGKDVAWHCVCDCGGKLYSDCSGEIDVRTYCLTSGMTQSCGCLKRDRTHETNFIDLTGRKIGKLTVLGIHHRDEKNRNYYWECECDCPAHNRVIIKGTVLNRGRTLSCGCLVGHAPSSKEPRENLVGRVFGKLTVEEYMGSSMWRCTCECGNETEVHTGHLNSGSITSCGRHVISKNGSSPEHEIVVFLENLIGKENIETHNRDLLGNRQEIDIYLPKYNIGIEYNGSCFHATECGVYKNLDKYYHQNKFLKAKENNIHLISIFDIDYEKDKNKVLGYLENIIFDNIEYDMPKDNVVITNNDYDDGEWLRKYGYVDVCQQEPESYLYNNKYLVYRSGKTEWHKI